MKYVYSAAPELWPVKLEELVDGSTGSDEVVRGGCLFAWKFSVVRSTLLTQAQHT
jgi:hypothetical protein